MKTSALPALLCACALAACSDPPQPSAGVAGDALSTAKLLSASALHRLPCLDETRLAYMDSSHSRAGTNLDFFTVADPVPHQRPYLYRDAQGRYVLLDADGPGILQRLWFTQLAPTTDPGITQGPLDETGRVQIFFDGESTPRVDLPATELFRGEHAPFLFPLCADHERSSGGNLCNLPMPFARRAVIAVTGRPNYWNLEYQRLAPGSEVRTFDPADPATLAAVAEAAEMLTKGVPISGGSWRSGRAEIESGQSVTLLQLAGTRVLDALELTLPADAGPEQFRLRAWWDGEPEPALDARLSELFLTGLGARGPARGLLAGYRPELRRGYLHLPMPVRSGARFALDNLGAAHADVRWRVHEAENAAAATDARCGRLRATAQENVEGVNGEDVPLLDVAGRAGKIVGFSYTVDGPNYGNALTTFLEGDERVYIDGAQTPQLYGTGTEDIFGGGFYYGRGPFSLATHGMTAFEDGGRGKRVAQYRLLPFGGWPFRASIRIGFEHGGGDGVPVTASSLVYWYALPAPRWVRTDMLDVGQAGDEAAHAYSGGALPALRLAAYFDGDRDGNLSSEAFDLAIAPGSLPALTPAELVTDDGRYHAVGETIQFTLAIEARNAGVVLRRRLDQILFDQRAEVLIDGVPAGTWGWPVVNDLKRWAEHDFLIPAALTAGKSRIAVTLRVIAPRQTPLLSSLSADTLLSTQTSLPSLGLLNLGGWSDFRYEAYSLAE